MKKWFEWQQQNQAGPVDSQKNFIFGNYAKATEFIKNYIEQKDYTVKFHKIFSPEEYANEICLAYNDYNLDKQQILEWLNEKEYRKLLQISGTGGTIENIPRLVLNNFIDNLGYFPVDWDSAKITILIQNPGDIFPLHYDTLKKDLYKIADNEQSIQRWLFMIYDKQPGQVFVMNGKDINWQAGDALHWNQTKHWHGTANFGYWPRYTLKITAKLLDPNFTINFYKE